MGGCAARVADVAGVIAASDGLPVADLTEWVADTRGVLDRAIRFSLDSDLEKMSEDAAQNVFQMAATLISVPLHPR